MVNALPRVGFIGFGDQGAPIAQAIIDGGYPLHAWARHPASLEVLGNRKFTAHDSLEGMARESDLVALCLPDDSDVLQLAVDGGLLSAMRPGSILVNHGTGLPSAAQHVAELGASHDIAVLDAPVSGGNAVARARQLTTMVGGEDEVVARTIAVFRTFSKTVIHVGPAGSGQFGKLFNNALMMMNHQSVIEVLQLAARLDLPTKSIVEVLRSGSATSFALQAVGPSITSDNVEYLVSLELADMSLFSAATSALGGERTAVVERAIAGANGLTGLTRLIELSYSRVVA